MRVTSLRCSGYASVRCASLFASCVLLLAGSAAWAQFNVGSGRIDPPFPMPPPNPDPSLQPTDFHAEPPDWMDTSAHFPGEPIGHNYDSANKIIRLANSSDSTKFKILWMDLLFNPGTTIGLPQLPGEPFMEDNWASVTTNTGPTITPTGASTDSSTGGATHVYQTWKIEPQPIFEYIDLTKLLAKVHRAQPDAIWTQTICVTPEPSSALIAIGGFLLLARRRFGQTSN